MRTNSAIVLGSVLLSFVFATGCTGNARAGGDNGEGQAKLEIKGNPETEFSGSCTIGSGEPEEIGGQVPQSFAYALNGNPLKCEIASEGEIEVNLTHGYDRSAQRISGGTLSLTYENGSISSSTSSSSSSTSSRIISSSGETHGTINESGNVASEQRDVNGFDEVELRGVGNLSIRQAGSESLTVEAEEDVLPKIRTEVVNNRLVISPEPNTNIQTTEPIDYKLMVKDLQGMEVSGSGDIDAEGISTDKLGINISGSGAIRASGSAHSQKIGISGSGTYRAADLESKQAEVDVEGAGSAIVNASEALNARVSGAGSVEYVGDPTVEKDVSGAGRVGKH